MNMRYGIFGGIFDPVHTGHLIMAERAVEELSLDRLIFIPAGNPPHKPDRKGASGIQRLEMLKAAVSDNPHFTVSDYELVKQDKSYTFETLTYFKNEYPDAELWFLMGGDSLHDLPTWRNPEIICKLANIAVAVRNSESIQVFAELIEKRNREFNANIQMLRTPNIEISSSDIRKRVIENRSIRYLVPSKVEEYILENGLYR